MVTAELDQPHNAGLARARACVTAFAAITSLTLIAAATGAIDRSLVPSTVPHATLTPSIGAWASIVIENARVLALPFGLVAFGIHRGRFSRYLGDAAIAGVLGVNAVRVGLALGRWQGRLLPYLPHVPLEWAAAAIAAGAWLYARTHDDQKRGAGLLIQAAITLATLAAAAAVEVLLTPHKIAAR
jgi:protein-S-isoprenylcysteine O-methyltransferase Ste14